MNENIDQYLETNLKESIGELSRLVAQPSVGAQNLGMEACANLVAEMLQQRGFSAKIYPTGGAPIVFGEREGKNNKTILFYNHYDVQPAEPLDLWESPPFEPSLRDGKLYGRGVSDDKGHITARLHAIDAILENLGELPCNIKFVIEGEEETSSAHLHDFVADHQDLLKADACVWEFGGVDHRDVPVQYLGLRGICYVELTAETANTDVHSGLGGSIFPNAAWRLIWALSTLKGPDENIRIEKFYDPVIEPTERDRELMAALPDSADEYKERYGVDYFLRNITGGTELHIAEVFQPTCTVCGLTSGYQGPGSKTVLPARASAKVDFRLVPDQSPERVLEQLRQHLDKHGFEDIHITYLGGEAPARTDPDDPFIQLVVNAARDVYASEMQLIPMSGGSGPNAPFIKILNLPVATAGMGYPGTRGHAPNENIRLDLYLKHAKHMARVIMDFSR
ncbi:MAG: M20/M25/M40 family metallo-hydrolase [Chloroflexota bacterium]